MKLSREEIEEISLEMKSQTLQSLCQMAASAHDMADFITELATWGELQLSHMTEVPERAREALEKWRAM